MDLFSSLPTLLDEDQDLIPYKTGTCCQAPQRFNTMEDYLLQPRKTHANMQ